MAPAAMDQELKGNPFVQGEVCCTGLFHTDERQCQLQNFVGSPISIILGQRIYQLTFAWAIQMHTCQNRKVLLHKARKSIARFLLPDEQAKVNGFVRPRSAQNPQVDLRLVNVEWQAILSCQRSWTADSIEVSGAWVRSPIAQSLDKYG